MHRDSAVALGYEAAAVCSPLSCCPARARCRCVPPARPLVPPVSEFVQGTKEEGACALETRERWAWYVVRVRGTGSTGCSGRGALFEVWCMRRFCFCRTPSHRGKPAPLPPELGAMELLFIIYRNSKARGLCWSWSSPAAEH
jgi:hypothetical protein